MLIRNSINALFYNLQNKIMIDIYGYNFTEEIFIVDFIIIDVRQFATNCTDITSAL